MKNFVCLCVICAVVCAMVCCAAPVFAVGQASAEDAVMSEQLIPSDDAGTAHDTVNAGTPDPENSAAAAESGWNQGAQGAITERSVSPVEENTPQTTGVGWFTVIVSIVIVSAVFAIVVALLPKRRGM